MTGLVEGFLSPNANNEVPDPEVTAKAKRRRFSPPRAPYSAISRRVRSIKAHSSGRIARSGTRRSLKASSDARRGAAGNSPTLANRPSPVIRRPETGSCVAASRNPRARSIRVSAAVMALAILNFGWNPRMGIRLTLAADPCRLRLRSSARALFRLPNRAAGKRRSPETAPPR